MQLQSLLYYRYLWRQALVLLFVSFFIALAISLVFIFVDIFGQKIIQYIIASLIWILPVYNLIFFSMWFIKFKQIKKDYQNQELLAMFKNDVIRRFVVNSSARIKFSFPPKKQFDDFVKIIMPEIEKQKKLLAIKKGEYK